MLTTKTHAHTHAPTGERIPGRRQHVALSVWRQQSSEESGRRRRRRGQHACEQAEEDSREHRGGDDAPAHAHHQVCVCVRAHVVVLRRVITIDRVLHRPLLAYEENSSLVPDPNACAKIASSLRKNSSEGGTHTLTLTPT